MEKEKQNVQENEGKKKNTKKVVAIVIAAIIVIAIIVGIIAVKFLDARQQIILLDEIGVLSQKVVGQDEYNTEIKTTGEYAKIEKTIKNYLQTYSDTIKNITDLSQSLTEFETSTEKDQLETQRNEIEQYKNDISQEIDILAKMTSQEYIDNEIAKENLSQKYVDLYNKLMGENIEGDLQEIQTKMNENKEKIVDVFDALLATYDYLIEHQDGWVSEDGQLLFYNTQELNEYNQLVQELQTKAMQLSSM